MERERMNLLYEDGLKEVVHSAVGDPTATHMQAGLIKLKRVIKRRHELWKEVV